MAGKGADCSCAGQAAGAKRRLEAQRVVRPEAHAAAALFRSDGPAVGADYNLCCKNMAKSPAAPVPVAAPATYEDALSELERLVAAMEGGQLALDKLLENYRRGAELLNFCRARLEAVEQQVKVLEDGQLKPWAGT